jgi:hypothetical protein
MRKWFSVLFCFMIIALILPMGCASGEMAVNVSNAIVKMHLAGIQAVDSEITALNKEYTNVLVKMQKLEQLVTPVTKWVEFQKTQSSKSGVLWVKEVTPEGLDQLKNDTYQISKLELVVKQGGAGIGWQFTSTIKVLDSATRGAYDLKVLQDDLASQKAMWEERRKAKLGVRDMSISTINNVLKYIDQWKIEKYNETTYIVNGQGLGWAEKLTSGAWTYYKDRDQMVPNGKPAEDLEKILSAR